MSALTLVQPPDGIWDQNSLVVKIVAADWVDHVQEAKFDGEWKIVNVLCELNPKPACERGARAVEMPVDVQQKS
jgi:hypothetical protein